MKTLEQTVRRISVGLTTLATTALLVIVSAASLFCGVTSARAQEPDNRIDWRWGRPGVMVVTNAPTAVTVTNIATEVATEVASGVANTMFGPRVTALEDALDGGTNNWNTAYSWGDWSAAVGANTAAIRILETNTVTRADTNGWETGSHASFLTSAPPQSVVSVNGQTGAVVITAQSLGAWQNPASATNWTWTSDGAQITLTGYTGPNDVVIPDMLDGLPVTDVGTVFNSNTSITSVQGGDNLVSVSDYAFSYCNNLTSVSLPSITTVGDYAFNNCISLTSVTLPSVTTIGDNAFSECYYLTSVSLPSVTIIGDYAFYGCHGLTSVPLPSATTIVANAFYGCDNLTSITFSGNVLPEQLDMFAGISPLPTIYVDNPTATGWGDTWCGAPVVRLDLHGDKIYQAGELVATTGHVAQAIAAIEFPVTSTNYTAWTGTITPADGTATVTSAHGNMPVLVTDAPCVLTLDPTGYGTAGVSRVSLSYYTGTNSFTFATNVITYSATPTVDTNGWNSLLIRRVSDGAWKGVGL